MRDDERLKKRVVGDQVREDKRARENGFELTDSGDLSDVANSSSRRSPDSSDCMCHKNQQSMKRGRKSRKLIQVERFLSLFFQFRQYRLQRISSQRPFILSASRDSDELDAEDQSGFGAE